MTDYREFSRLPDEPEYWRRLEDRIVTELGPRVHVGRRAGSFSPIASRAPILAMLAAAATVAALLVAPSRTRPLLLPDLGFLNVPLSDPAMIEFVSSPAPPGIGSLVLPGGARGER